MDFITNFTLLTHVFIPLLIFFARIMDVSLGTIRVIFISKGYKFLAPLLGFFEVLIWLLAIQQVLGNLTNIFTYIGYALGFASGTYVGIVLEEKLSVGKVLIRIIATKDAKKMLKQLKDSKYVFTSMGADGQDGKVKLILSIIKRKSIHKIVKIIKECDEDAYYSIEDVRSELDNNSSTKQRKNFWSILGSYRKGK